MSDKVDKHITCIIEDYKALKSEISRRSDLQRFALAAYGGIIVFSLRFNEGTCFSEFQITLIWITGVIAYLFYLSEDSFIDRLNKIANFNNWLINRLLNKESEKDQDNEEDQKNEKPLSDIHLTNNDFRKYIEKVNNKKKNKREEIDLKHIFFPSESAVIGRIIQTNRKVEFSNLLFLSSYLIILPLIISGHHFKSYLHIFASLNISLICFTINVVFTFYLSCKSFSKLSKFS